MATGFDINAVLASNPFMIGPAGTNKNAPGFAQAASAVTAQQNPRLAAAIENGTPVEQAFAEQKAAMQSRTPILDGEDGGYGGPDTGGSQYEPPKWDPSLPVSETNNPYTPQSVVNSATISRWQRVLQRPEEYGFFLRSIGIDSPPGAQYDLNRLTPEVKEMMTNLITRAAAGIGGGFDDFRGFFANQAKNLLIPTNPPQTTPLPEDQKPTIPTPNNPPTQPKPLPDNQKPPIPGQQPPQQPPTFPTMPTPGGGTKPIDPTTNLPPQPEPEPKVDIPPATTMTPGNAWRQPGRTISGIPDAGSSPTLSAAIDTQKSSTQGPSSGRYQKYRSLLGQPRETERSTKPARNPFSTPRGY